MPPLIILDTNVLISALMYPDSVSRQALVAAFRHFQPIVSAETWDELESVSARRKFARYFNEVQRLEFITLLARSVRFCEVHEPVSACSDPKDDKFLALALSQRCPLIVSGDKDLRDMHPFQGVAILGAGDFLKLWSGET